MTNLKKLALDTRGAASIEYLMIAGLVALVCIGAWRSFGGAVLTRINAQAGNVSTIQ